MVTYMDDSRTQSTEVRDLQLLGAERLDYNSQITMASNILGYRSVPVDIDTFLDDPYYMGNVSGPLYPFWRDKLRKIFPSPIHTRYPFLVFTGGLGTGKSTAVCFAMEYMKYRVSLLRDPYMTFNFVKGKKFKFSFFHKTNALAQSDFLDRIDVWEEDSPYFKDAWEKGSMDCFISVADSIRSNNNIGSDVIGYNLSELNFIGYDAAHEKLDNAFKRFNSRFERIRNYFGLLVVDTSSQDDDSIADDFIANNPYGDDVLAIFTNRWIVREHLNYYGRKGWFRVYKGDGTHQPFIVKPELGLEITSDMDPDRVLLVPEEVRADFEFDLITSLQDIAGISVSATDRFNSDNKSLLASFKLPQYSPDVVTFDFYDKTDKLVYRFDKSIREIPDDKIIFVRFDTAVVGDLCGLAISYFDKWVYYDKSNNDKVKLPLIKVPLAVGISRNVGEETSLDHLYEFCLDLNEKFEIGSISFDQYQSRMILQNLTRMKIPNKYLSVDRTDEAYVYSKNLYTKGLLEFPNNNLLKREFCNLRRIGNKIDHPQTNPDGSKGSKDISDAVVGCVYDLYQNLDKAGQLSVKYKVNYHSKFMEERAKKNDSQFQDMIAGYYQ